MTDVDGKATGWRAFFHDGEWRQEGSAKVVKKKAKAKKKAATKKKPTPKKKAAAKAEADAPNVQEGS
jgi:DNA topoisomerase-1